MQYAGTYKIYLGFNIMVDGHVYLLLRDKVVTPMLLQLDHSEGKALASQLNGLSECIASDVAVEGSLQLIESLVEVPFTFIAVEEWICPTVNNSYLLYREGPLWSARWPPRPGAALAAGYRYPK